jgi:drug/metabolite transporter (DMT)-like permease
MTRMPQTRVVVLTVLAMLAFAANSLLCRSALRSTTIDPATFTAIRLVSGACVLAVIVAIRGRARLGGNWWSALALFVYAAGFSLAYVGLPAAAGALLLFGSVQVTMHAWGIRAGERIGKWEACGLLLAAGGLVALLLPGLSAPPTGSAAMMICAGIAWGVYSLRGKGAGDPTAITAGNFLRSVPMALLLVLMLPGHRDVDSTGLALAVASGALASGVGYVIWYAALPSLRATTAAVVQLSVPVIAAIGGVVLLAEPVSLRLVLSALAVLGGVALALRRPVRVPAES